MATGGGWRINKGYEGQKYCIKRFCYDMLYITLTKCGFPKTHFEFIAGTENDYSHSDFVITIHSAVLCIAFSMRDIWKSMFEYHKKRSVLNNMEQVEVYLANIEELPDFRFTDELDKIRRSLAFYSELVLFLHSNDKSVDMKRVIFTWTNYFNEKIAVKEDPDVLLEALFLEDPDIFGYLSLVDCFIRDTAIPYGQDDNASQKYLVFCEEVEKFYRGDYTDEEESTEERSAELNPSSEEVEESVEFFSAVLGSQTDSSDISNPRERPESSHDLPSTSSSGKVPKVTFESDIIKPTEKKEIEDEVTMSQRKYFERPIETATGGVWRIDKGYVGQRYSLKRFAYDVLILTLTKCGFPKALLEVKFVKWNRYRHPDYALTIHSAVMAIALGMRDEWRHMFEYQKKRRMINDKRQVEEYLAKIEVLPEFRMTYDLDKIRRSLSFYSELMLFLHSYNIEVDFEKLLDIWENYFKETVGKNEDSDVLLEGIFIEDPGIKVHLDIVDCFLQEVAVPYGKVDDASRQFKIFSAELEKSYIMTRIGLAGHVKNKLLNLIRSLSPDLPSETVEESVSHISPVPETDSASPQALQSSEPPDHQHDPVRNVMDSVEQMNIGSEETETETESDKEVASGSGSSETQKSD